jgi:hypothetical protein
MLCFYGSYNKCCSAQGKTIQDFRRFRDLFMQRLTALRPTNEKAARAGGFPVDCSGDQ